MGNHLSYWRRCKPRLRDAMDNQEPTTAHEGIRTLKSNNSCDFSNESDLCICLVTWNMNGQVSYEDLVELVGSKRNFELLVVGLQEAPRTNISRMLQAVMAPTHILLGKAVMQSVQLYVFGPKNSKLLAREVKVDKHSVGGCGGLIRRKKGAVAICINFKGFRLVFISCHLSAHEHNVEQRNSQCQHISHSLFSKDCNPYAPPAQVTVWLGDLNYRLRGIDTHPARKLIHNDLQKELISKDQLLQEAERGEIFNGYCEGSLRFKPTYKYNVGSSDYDTSYKVRVPAWTDRILFKVDDADKIHATLHSYESVDNIESSDHKPVKAHLCLRVLPRLETLTSA
ncbi:type IV inositol polyphosphate 5-phosphatase 11 isoform X2 [Punica granatum]|uniref:Type IV inositol polyphosphate 5-phosphatase 11 isoform X2 n=1 Tax=Punica granatum TaxID=22663 RepID=A0A6P8C287_PUNGR|nr:type IV inositol polyphosphate 5-phosphatase 11 isoform X2 [Punica granatum]